jgi:hypothetical protein
MFTPEELTTRFDFCVPQAKWLSDLTGVQSDLNAVARICERVQSDARKFKFEPGVNAVAMMEERMLAADLVCAAIVRFMRTHGTGVRSGIPAAWLDELPIGLVTAHAYFKNLRDKFIAHSVNPLEDNQVFAWVRGYGTSGAQVTHVNASPGRYLPGADDAALLGRLTNSLLARVSQEIEAESARLLEIARRLSIDEVCKRGTEELPIPEPAKHAGSGRPPFKK